MLTVMKTCNVASSVINKEKRAWHMSCITALYEFLPDTFVNKVLGWLNIFGNISDRKKCN